MLDHHPDIAFNLESEFLVSDISDSGGFPDAVSYVRKLREDRVFRHSCFEIREGLGFPALVNDFLRQKLERDRKRIVGATVHYGFCKLRYVWPRAKYIYLLRDGRDVASSVVEMGWAGNVFIGANWWLEAEREWEDLQRSLAARDRWIEVRYEELIADSEAQLRRICEFIGVAFSERMWDYTESSSYSLPDPANASKWRRKVSPQDLQLLEARIGSRLAARGYEPTCTPPQVGPSRAKWIAWRSRLGLLKRRIETLGLWLFALELASRRLGWTSAHNKARHAIDAIIDQNLK